MIEVAAQTGPRAKKCRERCIDLSTGNLRPSCLEFLPLVTQWRTQRNLVLSWANRNLLSTRGHFQHRGRWHDQRGPRNTGKSARRKRLRVVLSVVTAEAANGRSAHSCGGSVWPEALAANLPTRAHLRLENLKKTSTAGAACISRRAVARNAAAGCVQQ
jgi:hypothetical protein